jgi:peptide chain release factor 1
MFDRLEIMKKQYQEMQDKLSTGTLEAKEMTKLMKESSAI